MYKYNEKKIIEELQRYIDKTYHEHYSIGKLQSTEFIIDNGHGTGFCVGNIMKYAQRYGKKGEPKDWRKDLFKVLHYALMQIYIHDMENREETKTKTKSSDAKNADSREHYKRRDEHGVNYRSIDEATPNEWKLAAEAYYGERIEQ